MFEISAEQPKVALFTHLDLIALIVVEDIDQL
jgi:hypothetical protein